MFLNPLYPPAKRVPRHIKVRKSEGGAVQAAELWIDPYDINYSENFTSGLVACPSVHYQVATSYIHTSDALESLKR